MAYAGSGRALRSAVVKSVSRQVGPSLRWWLRVFLAAAAMALGAKSIPVVR
ncbi:hypothetical protein [Streptomyces sp. NPDC004629]|uniref:hypothetical protein n=1 Tax=Streptomyces sp. NPDC004629 TaxID=3364705 RepID=UPI00369B94AA